MLRETEMWVSADDECVVDGETISPRHTFFEPSLITSNCSKKLLVIDTIRLLSPLVLRNAPPPLPVCVIKMVTLAEVTMNDGNETVCILKGRGGFVNDVGLMVMDEVVCNLV
ncbi:hypothetical protein BLNAU_22947 [Blattamonas nauphoetae]|uniref:Uncharacterized protein n=1 Tax=Blattamonas nauphoetae TaxID=2049346 RepID=A0ABQ9WRL0_9EUKA|nr:hypothetical protein BLNAU_22947 [Blattamonas nauphoetae]